VYGNPEIQTPNLDRLAAQGTLFTQFYAAGSTCSPWRSRPGCCCGSISR
jgi:arylsulfatase A-like enzyme